MLDIHLVDRIYQMSILYDTKVEDEVYGMRSSSGTLGKVRESMDQSSDRWPRDMRWP